MKLKVCGLKYPMNIQELAVLEIDYFGFIFYEASPRFAGESPFLNLPEAMKKVGVFVNTSIENILEEQRRWRLNFIQLHGEESPVFCAQLAQKLGPDIPVIKAFGIDSATDFEACNDYAESCSFFLFDRKSPQRGGTGKSFDWQLLEYYQGETPFWLSGGISPADGAQLVQLANRWPLLDTLDVNSRFEVEPGLKDYKLLEDFVNTIKYHENSKLSSG